MVTKSWWYVEDDDDLPSWKERCTPGWCWGESAKQCYDGCCCHNWMYNSWDCFRKLWKYNSIRIRCCNPCGPFCCRAPYFCKNNNFAIDEEDERCMCSDCCPRPCLWLV